MRPKQLSTSPSPVAPSAAHLRLRRVMLVVCGLVLRIFFRRIETAGAEHVPKAGPVLFVINHPNGLLDPLFVLCLARRRVSFLAKAPLFSTFLVGHFVRAFECLPVYRKQDGADPANNQEMLRHAVALLARGNAIALFPEGTSHSDPSLRQFKPGAARIALGATAQSAAAVQIVPVGLHYERKTTFRSAALVVFGAPVLTPTVGLETDGTVPRESIDRLTAQLSQVLGEITIQAESVEARDLAQRAELALRGNEAGSELLERLELQQRILAGYRELRTIAPVEVAALIERLDRHEAHLREHGLSLRYDPTRRGSAVGGALGTLLVGIAVLPLVLLGIALHYPTYRIVGALAFRLSAEEEDVVATMKVVSGLLLFPLTWTIFAIACWFSLGTWEALLVLALGPVSAYAALLAVERGQRAVGLLYAATKLALRPGLREALEQERKEIRHAANTLAMRLSDVART